MFSGQYRNDHALAISCRIVNGQFEDKSMYMPWSLIHANHDLTIERLTNSVYNTEYKVCKTTLSQQKTKKEYCIINDMDFHLMNKKTFMEIT